MAGYTDRFNIKRLAVIWMVILLCLTGAVCALKLSGRPHTGSNSIVHGIAGFYLFWITMVVLPLICSLVCFVCFSFSATFTVRFLKNFTFFTLIVFFSKNLFTYFTMDVVAVFFGTIFTKFRNRFNFLAMGTFF